MSNLTDEEILTVAKIFCSGTLFVQPLKEFIFSASNICALVRALLEKESAAIERAFQSLEASGVSRSRAKTVANGIQVLATRLDKQERAESAASAVPKWINVEDRLPDAIEYGVSDDVLVRFEDGDCLFDIANYDHETDDWSLPNNGFKSAGIDPIAWMPLPEYPK